MPILEARHDFAHPVEADTAWSESYYFNAYDPESDTGIFTRIGIRPNEGTMDVGLSAWLPGRDLAVVHGTRPQDTMTDSDLAVAGVRYERLVPMQEWRITADAEAVVRDLSGQRAPRRSRLALDMRFHGLAPAIGTDGESRAGAGASDATRATVAKGHLEQAGRWSGWIEVDGVRLTLAAARGNRDKSWGPRRWGGPRMWRWFSINVGDDTHLGGHPYRHRGGRPPPRLGVARRGAREHPPLGRPHPARARWPHARDDPRAGHGRPRARPRARR